MSFNIQSLHQIEVNRIQPVSYKNECLNSNHSETKKHYSTFGFSTEIPNLIDVQRESFYSFLETGIKSAFENQCNQFYENRSSFVNPFFTVTINTPSGLLAPFTNTSNLMTPSENIFCAFAWNCNKHKSKKIIFNLYITTYFN